MNSTSFRDIVQKEAIETLLNNTRGSIDISMRLGKTLIGLKVASAFDKVLVSYPNSSIFESWESDSLKFKIDTAHITFTTHVSLFKHDLDEYDCIILDEVDQVSLKGFEHLIKANVPNIYGMSGTMPLKGDKKWYIKTICPIVYSKKLDETTGITNKDYKIIVHQLAPSTIKNKPLSKGRFWSELDQIRFFDRKYQETKNFSVMLKLMHAIAYSETKYKYALELVNKLHRCIFFVETKKQCDDSQLPAYYSGSENADDNLEKFQEGELDKIVTINQLKAGISFDDLQEVVILHSYSANNRTAQKIGRCLQYSENQQAIIHIIVLLGTRDEKWLADALTEFDNNKIKYV